MRYIITKTKVDKIDSSIFVFVHKAVDQYLRGESYLFFVKRLMIKEIVYQQFGLPCIEYLLHMWKAIQSHELEKKSTH